MKLSSPTLVLSSMMLFSGSFLLAQEEKPRPSYRAARATAAPVIDGDLSDPAWGGAPEITGFTQREPAEGEPSSQKTTVRILYDDDAILFGIRLDDTAPVTPLLARRDSDLNNGDYVRIAIDSQHDRLNGAAFVVNASNVQRDSTLSNDTNDDSSWDAVWSSATKIDAGGWSAEVRIPYSQLRFPNRAEHTWGFNVSRWIASKGEASRLVFTPRSVSAFVSHFADLTGISGIKPRRTFEIVPYGVARTDMHSRADNPFIPATAHRMDAGLDVKYGLTSSLTLTGTINPDFGQVEVDPAVLNLSQFETFFPEKRPFFTEGASIFRFGNGPANSRWSFNTWFPTFFYSRRIGRTPQAFVSGAEFQDAPGETTILGAAKVTGKVGKGWTVGILNALTDEEQAWYQRDDLSGASQRGKQTVEPMTNYLVARAAKEYGRDSKAGFMFTAVNRKLDGNLDSSLREGAYFGGIDGYSLFKNKSWILEWLAGSTMVQGSEGAIERTQRSGARYYDRPDAGHIELDPTRTALTGWMARGLFAKQTGRWRPNVQIQMVSPGFEVNDVGFLPRTDAVSTHGVLQYLNTDQTKYTREIGAWVAKHQNWNFDRDLTSNGFSGNLWAQFKNYVSAWAWGGTQADHIDDRITRGGPAMLYRGHYFVGGGLETDGRKKVSGNVETEWVEDGFGGTFKMLSTAVTYRPTPAMRFSVSPSYQQANQVAQYVATIADPSYAPTYGRRYLFATLKQRTFEVGVRTEWTVSSRLSFQLFLQPFIASGDYEGYKHLTRGRDDEFTPIDTAFNSAGNSYRVNGDGDYVFGNPDFNFRSVRGSAVVRWEFRPGSSLYVVWSENRSDVAPVGDFRPRRDFGALPNAPSQDVILVKFSYWLPV